MRAYQSSVFFAALAAILAPVVGGTEDRIHAMLRTESYAAKATSTTSTSRSAQTAQRRSNAQALEEAYTGPDPFFSDLIGIDVRASEDEGRGTDGSTTAKEDREEEAMPPRTYYVEVYENEFRGGLSRRWRELRPLGRSVVNLRWSYNVCILSNSTYFVRLHVRCIIFWSPHCTDLIRV